MAPHGCYPCLGEDRWIAIAVADDDQWTVLCDVLGNPPWSRESRFDDTSTRWKHRDQLDSLLGGATGQWDQYELMHALQQRAVPAGAVLDGKQLLSDPHLKARGSYELVHHHPSTGMPPLPYTSRPWKFSETPGSAMSPAPTLGEHNGLVLSEILGKPQAQMAELERQGVIGHEPVNPRMPNILSLEDQQRQGRIIAFDEDFRDQLEKEYGI